MADQDTSIVTGDNLLMVLFSRKLIKTLHEKVAFYQLADKFPIPQGSGNQTTFNGWRKIAAASSNLAEASSNSAVNMSSRKVNVTINSYGRHVKITDLAELTSIIGPVEGAVRELTQSAALTLDNAMQLAIFHAGTLSAGAALLRVGQLTNVKTKLLSAWLAAQTSSFCASDGATGTQSGGSSISRIGKWGFPVKFAGSSSVRLSSMGGNSTSSTPGPIALRRVSTQLKRLAVEPFSNGRYVGVAHPNWIAGMFANPDYKQYVVNYAEGPRESMFKGSITHTVHNIELVESPNVPRYATSALSCTPLVVVGQGALGCVELGGGTQIIIKRPGPSTVSEPYDLAMTVSYKLRVVGAILNPSAGCISLCRERL